MIVCCGHLWKCKFDKIEARRTVHSYSTSLTRLPLFYISWTFKEEGTSKDTGWWGSWQSIWISLPWYWCFGNFRPREVTSCCRRHAPERRWWIQSWQLEDSGWHYFSLSKFPTVTVHSASHNKKSSSKVLESVCPKESLCMVKSPCSAGFVYRTFV